MNSETFPPEQEYELVSANIALYPANHEAVTPLAGESERALRIHTVPGVGRVELFLEARAIGIGQKVFGWDGRSLTTASDSRYIRKGYKEMFVVLHGSSMHNQIAAVRVQLNDMNLLGVLDLHIDPVLLRQQSRYVYTSYNDGWERGGGQSMSLYCRPEPWVLASLRFDFLRLADGMTLIRMPRID